MAVDWYDVKQFLWTVLSWAFFVLWLYCVIKTPDDQARRMLDAWDVQR
jgi:hypothetical protein